MSDALNSQSDSNVNQYDVGVIHDGLTENGSLKALIDCLLIYHTNQMLYPDPEGFKLCELGFVVEQMEKALELNPAMDSIKMALPVYRKLELEAEKEITCAVEEMN